MFSGSETTSVFRIILSYPLVLSLFLITMLALLQILDMLVDSLALHSVKVLSQNV